MPAATTRCEAVRPSTDAGAPAARILRRHTPAGWVLIGVIAFLTFSPVVAMFYGAISAGLFTGGSGFTFDAVESVYSSPNVLKSLGVTFALAISVGVLSTILGVVFAWLLARTDTPARRLMELIVISPILTSPLISALMWFTLASPRSGVLNVILSSVLGSNVEFFNVTSLSGIVWVLVLHFEPYAYLLVVSALRNMDASLEEASFINGSGMLDTLRRVTLPMVFPSIGSACLFIVVLTAGEFSVPAVLGLNLRIAPLPLLIYRTINGSTPDYSRAASIGTMLFLVSLLLFYLYRRMTKLERRFVTISGRGLVARRTRLGGFRYVAAAGIAVYGLVAVILPWLALVFTAITPYAMRDLSHVVFTPGNVWTVLSSADFLSALINTVEVVAATAAICIMLAFAAAFVAKQAGGYVSATLDYLSGLPLAIPAIVLGAGLIWIYVRTPLYATLGLLVVGLVTMYIPHAYRVIRNGLMQLDRQLEEASYINGAGNLRTGFAITRPLLSPAIFSAVILVVIFALREVNVVVLLYSPESRVLSVLTWEFIDNGALPSAAVMGLALTLMLIAALIIGRVVFRANLSKAYR